MRLAILLLCVSILPAAAQEVEWESLDGPYTGVGGTLLGDAVGFAYRFVNTAGVGHVVRSADGLTWEQTAYPGSFIRLATPGVDGSLLVSSVDGVLVGTDGGDTWVAAGLAGETIGALARTASGRLFALVGSWNSCEILSSPDAGGTWTALQVPSIGSCNGLITSDGGSLVIRGPLDAYNSTPTFWTNDLGQTWQYASIGGSIARFVRGQHGGTFALVNGVESITGFSFPPSLRRFVGGGWHTIVTQSVTGVTSRPDGSVIIGFADGRLEGMDDIRVARPFSIVGPADGSVIVSTSGAGRWRYSEGDGWRQQAATQSSVRALAVRGDHVYASVGENVLVHDGERWRATGWTRAAADALAFHGEDVWLAAAGWFWNWRDGRDDPRSVSPTLGVYRLGSTNAFEIAPECSWASCAAPAVVVSGDVAIASHIGTDWWKLIDPAEGLVRSADGGETWEPVIPGVAAICHLAGDVDRGFAASVGACSGIGIPAETFYRSADAGLTWTAVTDGLPSDDVQSLAVGPDETSYLGLHQEGVFRLDGSGIWEAMGPEGSDFVSVDVTSRGQVVAAIDGALRVFDGVNWAWLATPAAGVHAVHVADGDVLYVATSQGLYRTDGPLVVSTEESAAPVASSLESVHPNPARGEVTATFRLADTGTVEIAMYDLLGRRVAVLADGEYASGSHAIRFDTAGLAAGVYVVELRAAGERWARRVSILGP